jgi:ABC-type glucose/galactose transport system permease subunit
MAETMMPNPKSAFMVLGVLAIVFGIINYLMSALSWEPYMAWIAGGVILLLASWAKGSMKD